MALTFDWPSKVITLTAGTTSLWVRDLWSRWVDWFLTSDNNKYLPAFQQVGGNDIDVSAGTSIPIYAFLMNWWRLKPQEANHTLSVNDGILLVNGGWDPFINTIGAYTVRINYSQPVQAITVATGGGGGSGATPAEIWEYSNRTLTESAGLTTEEHDKLFSLEKSTGGGWFINYQAINSHTTEKVNELKKAIESKPDYTEKLNEIVSQNKIAKEDIIDTIKEAETEVCSDIIRKTKEIKEDNITTRNLVRQKTKKIDENVSKLADRQDKTDRMIESEADEIEKLIEQNIDFEADEIEKQIQEQIDKEIEEIESNQSNDGNNNGTEGEVQGTPN